MKTCERMNKLGSPKRALSTCHARFVKESAHSAMVDIVLDILYENDEDVNNAIPNGKKCSMVPETTYSKTWLPHINHNPTQSPQRPHSLPLKNSHHFLTPPSQSLLSPFSLQPHPRLDCKSLLRIR